MKYILCENCREKIGEIRESGTVVIYPNFCQCQFCEAEVCQRCHEDEDKCNICKDDKFLISIVSKRIRVADYNPHYFYYHLRHGDDWGIPITLEKEVFVNHYASLVSTKPLDYLFKERDYYQFKRKARNIIWDIEDLGFHNGLLLFKLPQPKKSTQAASSRLKPLLIKKGDKNAKFM